MSFASPLFLAGLVLLVPAIALYVRAERRRARSGTAWAPAALMPSVLPKGAGWRRHVPLAVYAVALAALVVALARPQTTVAVPVEQATVVVVTDRSGSMLATDVAPSRLAAARRAANTFLDTLPRTIRVGAVTFNQTATVLQPPTRDHEAVRASLDAIAAAGSTATGEGLASALALIRSTRRAGAAKPPPSAIVLLSDGKSVRGRDPLVIADEARKAGVPVYAVALGTPTGTITDKTGRIVPVPPDSVTLARIAEITGGQSFTTADAGRLARIYERLGRQVATEKRDREMTNAFAGGALALLAAAALSSLRWFGRFV